tara:strand:- start:3713 stop:4321 length:609 start_codon:yes stop_codon:yes gene_type:complete
MMNVRSDLKNILKLSLCFGLISFSFSIIGGLVPDNEHSYLVGNPLEHNSVTIEHIFGHIFWGAIIGIGGLSIRYIILGGSFAILLDTDHLLQFLDIEMIARMSHSIPFAIIAAVAFYFIFSKKDVILATVSFSAILSHLAFDIFLADVAMNSSTNFPLFSPIIFDDFALGGIMWLYLEILAVIIVLIPGILNKRKQSKKIVK